MLRDFLSNITLLELPLVAMSFFLLLFLAVVWRVTRKARGPAYRRMAQMPLQDDVCNESTDGGVR